MRIQVPDSNLDYEYVDLKPGGAYRYESSYEPTAG